MLIMNSSKKIKAETPKIRSQKKSGNFFSKGTFIQPKLTIGPSNDQYEREADMIAEHVVSTPENHFIQPKISSISIQKKCAACEKEEEEKVQRKIDGQNDSHKEIPSIVNNVLNASGEPLDTHTRSYMENRFGHDFSNILIHTNSIAAKSAQSISALAYTLGNHIVFNQGKYSPYTNAGKRLLAHELTHTIQQNRSPQNAGNVNQEPGVIANAPVENVIQRDRNPDVVHNGYYSFYLLGGGGREFALQFHFTGEGNTATVKLASLRHTAMIEETYTLQDPAAFAPQIIYEDGVTTLIDIDGDGRAEFEVSITNNALYSVDYLTSTSTPGDPRYSRHAVRESFAILRWGDNERMLTADVEEHAPAWIIRPHPHPHIDFMYHNRVTRETFIPSILTPVSRDFRGVRSGRIAITNRDVTVLDWGESWNGFNAAGGILTIGEIDASSVENMVEQVEDSISEGSCINTLTIIGHGSPGSISVGDGTARIEGKYIGGGALDSTSDLYNAEMARFLARLTPLFCSGASATLRGCNVGDGALGASFVQNLANLWRVHVRAHVGTVRGGGYWTTGNWTEADPQ